MRNFDAESELSTSLSAGEKLIWAGKPKTGIVFRSSDLFVIPFSMVWAGFAVYWETSVVSSGAPLFFKLWGIPFLIVGLYITVGRFFIDAKKRANTFYGLTSDRIIIRSGFLSINIKSVYVKSLSEITFSQKSDNSGTIILGPTEQSYSMVRGMERPLVKQPPKLECIDDVKAVYDKIIGLQRQK